MSQITKPAENSRRNNQSDRPRRERKQQEEAPWIPKTILGKKVASGEITSLEEIIQSVVEFKRQELSKNYCLI